MPQGSCLGPLLFLIYINDISNICKSNELTLFADDTNISVKEKSKQEVYIEANMILKQLSVYTMLNKLHVNLEKSCFMYFTKTSSDDENDNENDNIPPMMIGPIEIKRVSEIKFLGVVIRACLITLHSNFEIFQKGHPAVKVMLDRRIFERRFRITPHDVGLKCFPDKL